MTDATAEAKRKVLVVDDEPLIRMSTCDMLQEIGLDAAEAGSGEDALALLERDTAIGVLVTDLGLPGMSGEEFLRRARKMRPQLKFIVATGRAAEDAALADVAYLAKPFDTGELRRAIETV